MPVGKVRRRLEFDALADTGSPDWMTREGNVTEESTSIREGRGELELTINDSFGGYSFPPVDPTAFREIRLGIAIRDGLSESNTLSLGFQDAVRIENSDQAVRYLEAGGSPRNHVGHVVYRCDGDREQSGPIGATLGAIAEANADICSWLEVRIRPFEHGVSIRYGGANRGDVAYEATDQPFGVMTPMRPMLAFDTTHAGTKDTVGLAKIWFVVVHN